MADIVSFEFFQKKREEKSAKKKRKANQRRLVDDDIRIKKAFSDLLEGLLGDRNLDELPAKAVVKAPRGVQLLEKEWGLFVRFQLQGFLKDELQLRINSGMLCLDLKQGTEDDQHIIQGISQCLPLPFAVDENKASATFEKGILSVKLPKRQAERRQERFLEIEEKKPEEKN